jgi:hypothetical protein
VRVAGHVVVGLVLLVSGTAPAVDPGAAKAAAGGAAQAQATAVEWTMYDNARFGFSVRYPAKLLSPRPRPTNGDGRKFAMSAFRRIPNLPEVRA